MEKIGAAAIALVIGRDKVEKLVAAQDRLEATGETVRSSITEGETETAPIAKEDQLRILNSPAGKRLTDIESAREPCLSLRQ